MLDLDYIPISIATLLPSDAIGLDLYKQERHSRRPVLYRGAEYPLSLADLEHLRNRGVHRLYIKKSSQASYQDYLRQVVAEDDSNEVPIAARASALAEVVRDVLQKVFASDKVDQAVQAAEELGSLAADILSKDTFAAHDLFCVLHHDYTTFTHSANVAFFCGILAAGLGFDSEEVKQVTTGGLLHDLGKLEINQAILCKTGHLDEYESRLIRLHPILGFRRLAHRTDLVEGQLMMTYQHHERLDGKGYPVGCVGADIHPWARLCTVVDVFEALTSSRPYRTPMSAGKAIMLQERDSGTAFDPEMLACWKSIIQQNFGN